MKIDSINRRTLLKGAGLAMTGTALAPTTMLANANTDSKATQQNSATNAQVSTLSRRKLGGVLEVSSIGLGVQNMSRTYQTTIPTRSQMHRIIQTAFANGVTFFDAAEAYWPSK